MSSAHQNSKELLYAIANDKVFTGGNYNTNTNTNNYPVSSDSENEKKPAYNSPCVTKKGEYPNNHIGPTGCRR
jgi:hypothetical protein